MVPNRLARVSGAQGFLRKNNKGGDRGLRGKKQVHPLEHYVEQSQEGGVKKEEEVRKWTRGSL